VRVGDDQEEANVAKVITAKFGGVCGKCGIGFAAGTAILWEKGTRSEHAECPDKTSAPAAPSGYASLTEAPYVVREKWEASRRDAFDRRRASAVGEQRRFAKKSPDLRAGATGEIAPGLFVVVGTDRGRFESAEENEDMGDMSGAGWHVCLYLRRATAEEVAADAAATLQEQLGQAFVQFGLAIVALLTCRAIERGQEMVAVAVQGSCRTAAWSWPALRAAGVVPESEGVDRSERVASWPGVDYPVTLTRYPTTDGRSIYLLDSSRRDWDIIDCILPVDLAERMWDAMLAQNPISPDQASDWLAKYRECSGREFYQYAASKAAVAA